MAIKLEEENETKSEDEGELEDELKGILGDSDDVLLCTIYSPDEQLTFRVTEAEAVRVCGMIDGSGGFIHVYSRTVADQMSPDDVAIEDRKYYLGCFADNETLKGVRIFRRDSTNSES
jgi:hypothetical protein